MLEKYSQRTACFLWCTIIDKCSSQIGDVDYKYTSTGYTITDLFQRNVIRGEHYKLHHAYTIQCFLRSQVRWARDPKMSVRYYCARWR